MVIFSEGITNEAKEYNDTDVYGVDVPNTKNYQFWENKAYHEEKGKYKFRRYGERLTSIDIHSSKTSNFWEKFQKLKKDTNLNYKDLMGTYQFDSCSKDFTGVATAVYKKVLNDGTESYFYKSRLGQGWQVIRFTYNLIQ